MAEYITKEQTLEAFVEWTNSREDYAEHPVWFARNIGSIKSADVVEKSEIMDLIKRGWSAENIITEIMRD